MSKQTFTHAGLSMSYLKRGAGEHTLICFHGYGLEAASFDGLVSVDSDDFTMYSFDMPFNGAEGSPAVPKSNNEALYFGDICNFLEAFIAHNEISTYSLVGYSMGARCILAAIQKGLVPRGRVHLIAPDGFIKNGWYSFAVRTSIGRRLFRSLPRHFKRFIGLASFMRRLGLIHAKLERLVKHNIGSKEKAQKLFNTWSFLAPVDPDLRKVEARLEMESIELIVHLGRYDRIIPATKVLKWSAFDLPDVRAIMHDSGHRMLTEDVFLQMRAIEGHESGM